MIHNFNDDASREGVSAVLRQAGFLQISIAKASVMVHQRGVWVTPCKYGNLCESLRKVYRYVLYGSMVSTRFLKCFLCERR